MLLEQGRVIVALTIVVSVAAAAKAEYMLPREPAPSAAELAVRKVVEQHIAGIVSADAKQIESAWDTQAGRITSVARGDDGDEVVTSGPIADAIELWSKEKLTGTAGEILSVDVVNDRMALVKAQITWNRQVFDDYLVLLATDGQWKLVSKTYTAQNANRPWRYGVSRVDR